jgi:hypothetical protein
VGIERCRNCNRRNQPLLLVSVPHPKTKATLTGLFCEKCKEIVESYCASPLEQRESSAESVDDLFKERAKKIKRERLPDRPERSFTGTECRVDVFTFMTSTGTEGMKLEMMNEKEKKWGYKG